MDVLLSLSDNNVTFNYNAYKLESGKDILVRENKNIEIMATLLQVLNCVFDFCKIYCALIQTTLIMWQIRDMVSNI